jgi:hypothetical protein
VVVRKDNAKTMAVKRTVDKVAIATGWERDEIGSGEERGTERGNPTWISGEADYLGAGEAVHPATR